MKSFVVTPQEDLKLGRWCGYNVETQRWTKFSHQQNIPQTKGKVKRRNTSKILASHVRTICSVNSPGSAEDKDWLCCLVGWRSAEPCDVSLD